MHAVTGTPMVAQRPFGRVRVSARSRTEVRAILRQAESETQLKERPLKQRFPSAQPIILLLPAAFVSAEPTLILILESPQNGLTVAPGTAITRTINAAASERDNRGLALISCDLVQSPDNSLCFDLTPANGVPREMTNFSRPQGVSNPGEGGGATGYVGVQRGPNGETYRDLIQIGGGQNTFGAALLAGSDIAENAEVVADVGVGTPAVIAAGSLVAQQRAFCRRRRPRRRPDRDHHQTA